MLRLCGFVSLLAISLYAYSPRHDLDAGRFIKALSEAEARIKLTENDGLAWAVKSQALCAMLRFPEALVAAEKAITLQPNLADGFLARGLARAGTAVQQRNFSSLINASGAMEDLNLAVKKDPRLMRAWMALGLAYEQLPGLLGGSTKKALRCAESLKRVHNARGEALAGTILSLESRWKDAEACFQRALASNSRDPEVVYAYLDALASRETRKQLGVSEQKKLISQETRRLMPDAGHKARAVEGICDALLDAGEAEFAWRYAMESLPKTDSPSLIRLQLGKLSARAGIHREEALAILDQVVREPLEGGSGGYPAAYWRRGQILKDLGRKQEAKASIQETLKWDPNHQGAKSALKELGN